MHAYAVSVCLSSNAISVVCCQKFEQDACSASIVSMTSSEGLRSFKCQQFAATFEGIEERSGHHCQVDFSSLDPSRRRLCH